MKKTPIKNSELASFRPVKSVIEITDAFITAQTKSKPDKGENDSVKDFALLARMIAANYSTFSFNDFLSMSRSMNTEASALNYLFREWIDELNKNKRLSINAGIYDYPQYSFK